MRNKIFNVRELLDENLSWHKKTDIIKTAVTKRQLLDENKLVQLSNLTSYFDGTCGTILFILNDLILLLARPLKFKHFDRYWTSAANSKFAEVIVKLGKNRLNNYSEIDNSFGIIKNLSVTYITNHNDFFGIENNFDSKILIQNLNSIFNEFVKIIELIKKDLIKIGKEEIDYLLRRDGNPSSNEIKELNKSIIIIERITINLIRNLNFDYQQKLKNIQIQQEYYDKYKRKLTNNTVKPQIQQSTINSIFGGLEKQKNEIISGIDKIIVRLDEHENALEYYTLEYYTNQKRKDEERILANYISLVYQTLKRNYYYILDNLQELFKHFGFIKTSEWIRKAKLKIAKFEKLLDNYDHYAVQKFLRRLKALKKNGGAGVFLDWMLDLLRAAVSKYADNKSLELLAVSQLFSQAFEILSDFSRRLFEEPQIPEYRRIQLSLVQELG